jgi:hypothetical protein
MRRRPIIYVVIAAALLSAPRARGFTIVEGPNDMPFCAVLPTKETKHFAVKKYTRGAHMAFCVSASNNVAGAVISPTGKVKCAVRGQRVGGVCYRLRVCAHDFDIWCPKGGDADSVPQATTSSTQTTIPSASTTSTTRPSF